MWPNHMIVSLLALTLAGAAQPQTTTLLATELQERCSAYTQDPDSAEGAFCLSYVQGFLDGAASIDTRMRAANETVAESWIERAHRTRLGPEWLGAPAYCIAADEPLDRIIGRIVTYGAERAGHASLLASDYLALALRRLYPC